MPKHDPILPFGQCIAQLTPTALDLSQLAYTENLAREANLHQKATTTYLLSVSTVATFL